MRRALTALVVFGAAALAFAFLLLPIVALFTRQSPRELVHQLSNPVVTDALVVSAKTSAIAQLAILLFGTPTAYLIARRSFPGRAFVVTLVELPLVLPPAVAGIGLIVAFGRFGLLGGTFSALGIDLAFNQTAVVLAVAFVASPLYMRQAIASFEAVDGNLVAASRTLGAGTVRTFFRVVLPLARGGLAAGAALSLARGLGEYGSVVFISGNLPMKTEIAPLLIIAKLEQYDYAGAAAIAVGMLVASFVILFAINRLQGRSRRFLETKLS